MINETVKGIELTFQADNNVFSPSSIDKGTLAMLSQVDFCANDKVLDLGCGYGIVGILTAKLIGESNVLMCDISDDAIRLAKINATLNNVSNIKIVQSNGFSNITDNDFTIILSNPPYHTDFSVVKNFIENGFKRLTVGGRIVMVTKRLDWYKNKLASIFGGVRVEEVDGYYIFISEKRNILIKKKEKPKKTMSKKLQRKYAK